MREIVNCYCHEKCCCRHILLEESRRRESRYTSRTIAPLMNKEIADQLDN
jgi:hypothetical protein